MCCVRREDCHRLSYSASILVSISTTWPFGTWSAFSISVANIEATSTFPEWESILWITFRTDLTEQKKHLYISVVWFLFAINSFNELKTNTIHRYACYKVTKWPKSERFIIIHAISIRIILYWGHNSSLVSDNFIFC